MNASELLDLLWTRGIHLEPVGGKLRVRAAAQPNPATYDLIREHKATLLALLEPQRDKAQADCPQHWTHIPELPPKGARVLTGTPEKPERYRVRLFGTWFIIRFEPTISETHISVTCAKAKRRMFADLNEFYRWAWAEMYASSLTYRETN